jgi:hypothetical protein
MSLLSAFTKKTKLQFAKKKLANARESQGSKADYLYESANKMFEEVAEEDKLKAEALYNWGFSLYNQGKTKTAEEAEALLNKACEKFAASMDCDLESIKPPIDWGVTLMALAELKNANSNDELYDLALEKFKQAEERFFGSASYNLACIYALRGDEDACKQALEDSRDNASLPSKKEILDDPDLNNVKETAWFKEFIPTMLKPPPTRKTFKQLKAEAEAAKAAKEKSADEDTEKEN